jgi:hypothetical protein
MDNFENLILMIDEIVDEGIVVTVEAPTIIARCTMKDCDFINITN